MSPPLTSYFTTVWLTLGPFVPEAIILQIWLFHFGDVLHSFTASIFLGINNVLLTFILSWISKTFIKILSMFCWDFFSLNTFRITMSIKHSGRYLQSQLLGRMRREYSKFEANLGNLVRPCLQKEGLGVQLGVCHFPRMHEALGLILALVKKNLLQVAVNSDGLKT